VVAQSVEVLARRRASYVTHEAMSLLGAKAAPSHNPNGQRLSGTLA
jgi:hypothetical protein